VSPADRGLPVVRRRTIRDARRRAQERGWHGAVLLCDTSVPWRMLGVEFDPDRLDGLTAAEARSLGALPWGER
jgi:hypothetical protein